MPRRRRATTRRRRTARRISAIRKNPRAKMLGRSGKNIAIGSVLVNATSRLIGGQTARAGVYALPLNLAIAGTVGNAMGAGQKDLVSAGVKLAGSRFITTQLEPRLMGVAGRNGTQQGGGT
jgi:hypothetical protein